MVVVVDSVVGETEDDREVSAGGWFAGSSPASSAPPPNSHITNAAIPITTTAPMAAGTFQLPFCSSSASGGGPS